MMRLTIKLGPNRVRHVELDADESRKADEAGMLDAMVEASLTLLRAPRPGKAARVRATERDA